MLHCLEFVVIYDGPLRPVHPDILRRFGELLMATSIAPLSKSGYALVLSALELKHASLMRSIRSESDTAVRDLRQKQADEVLSLIAGFRQSAS